MSTHNRLAFVVPAIVALAASIGCSKPAPPAPARVEPAAVAQTPWSSASTWAEVTRFGVNEPRADGRACWTARYAINVAKRTLHVETCIGDDPVARDVTLSDADLAKAMSALASLRQTSSSTCDAKGSTFLAQIYDRPNTLSHYTDAANGCHAGDMTTLDRKGLESLFATLASIEPTSRS